MSPKPPRPSSSSDSDPRPAIDERKWKRMESNKESARRCRMRKQQRLEDLVNEVARLKEENGQIEEQISLLLQHYLKVESDNTVMRTHFMELSDRLQSLNSLLRSVEDFSGMAMDIPEFPEMADPLLKPWALPFPVQPISASAEIFHC